MQEKNVRNEKVSPEAYYKNLNKVDKIKFIGFMMWKFGLTYDQAWNRLNGRTSFSNMEMTIVQPIVDEETWRN